jgi:hypothetical protein
MMHLLLMLPPLPQVESVAVHLPATVVLACVVVEERRRRRRK